MVMKEKILYLLLTVLDLIIVYFLCFVSIGTKETSISIYKESPAIIFLETLAFSIIFTTIMILFLISIFVFCTWLIIKRNKYSFYIATILLTLLFVFVLDTFVNVSTTHIIPCRIFSLSFSLLLGYLFYLSRHFIRKRFNRTQNISFKVIMHTLKVNFFIICIESLFVLLYKLSKYGYV